MQRHTYCWQQILLHWVSALVIVWALVSGFYVTGFVVEPATAQWVGFVNVGLTTLFIPVFLLRWFMRYLKARPSALSENALVRRIAHVFHEGIYWLIALVLTSGVLMMDRAIDVFGWFAIAPLLTDPFWLSAWLTVHVAANVALALAVALHVAAVAMHEFAGRSVLRRMLP
ncbi:hypothetical protein BGP84_05160 [Pseudomonas putida]|jgi:cytochrome b561|uniref:Cytochrome b561 bacterial/Ni-hydrogenase domain-containing protein n=1 Tax=Pseudomonas putida TaxID=303 RepID=A0A2S3XBE0_PSEPU|nr:cytochrome b/b6 domain-containing protein [Pseudomonas putida]POG02214.1 hypothetical protein BGP85_26415 [Pseudomonas putida]POG12880.1 hypothetical protein BGP84_05160 [Pseudomonas putida]